MAQDQSVLGVGGELKTSHNNLIELSAFVPMESAS